MRKEDIIAHQSSSASLQSLLNTLVSANKSAGAQDCDVSDEITLAKYKRVIGLGCSLTGMQDQWHFFLLTQAPMIGSAQVTASRQELIEQLSDLEADVAHFSEELHKEKGASTHQQWRAILKGQTNATSKRAFKASHLPDQWRPCDIPIEGSRVTSADPLKVLTEEARKLAVLWHETVRSGNGLLNPEGNAGHGTPMTIGTPVQSELGTYGNDGISTNAASQPGVRFNGPEYYIGEPIGTIRSQSIAQESDSKPTTGLHFDIGAESRLPNNDPFNLERELGDIVTWRRLTTTFALRQ